MAEHFGIRQQRALAILALQEREHQAREHGLPMHSELAGGQGRWAGVGSGRRNVCMCVLAVSFAGGRACPCAWDMRVVVMACGKVSPRTCMWMCLTSMRSWAHTACLTHPLPPPPHPPYFPAEAMEDAYDAVENVGARERHHVVLPSFPNYRVRPLACRAC